MSLREDAWARITNAPGLAGTSFSLTTGHGARFPANTVGHYARVYDLADPGIWEEVYVGGRSTDSLTPVTRNTGGTGAVNITAPSGANGFAIEAIHKLKALEAASGVFLNQSNNAAAFAAWAPTTSPAKLLQTLDQLKHRAYWLLTNATGIAHTFTLTLGFGKSGVAQQIFQTLALSIPAGTTYYVETDVFLTVTGTAAQAIISKSTIFNAGTAAVIMAIAVVNGTFDTNANDFHFLHTGLMDAASASLVFQGYNIRTELVRGA